MKLVWITVHHKERVLETGAVLPAQTSRYQVCQSCLNGHHMSYGTDHRSNEEGDEGRRSCKNVGILDNKQMQCMCSQDNPELFETIEKYEWPTFSESLAKSIKTIKDLDK